MITLTNLTGTITEQPFKESGGILRAVHAEPAPGIHVRVLLGSAGLVVRQGDHAVALPLPELLKLLDLAAATPPPPTPN